MLALSHLAPVSIDAAVGFGSKSFCEKKFAFMERSEGNITAGVGTLL